MTTSRTLDLLFRWARSAAQVCIASAVLSMTGCAEILDYGPERKLYLELLYGQNAEAVSGAGRCDGEVPAFGTVSGEPITADCDDRTAPLSGTQSIALSDAELLACDPCWQEQDELELWVEFLFRVDANTGYFVRPFVPIARGTSGTASSLLERETGIGLLWGRDLMAAAQAGQQIAVYCDGRAIAALPVSDSVTHRVEYRHSYATGIGELWVSGADDSPRRAGTRPDIAFTCMAARAPSGFFAAGLLKPGGTSGTFYLDDIRVATSLRNLRGPL